MTIDAAIPAGKTPFDVRCSDCKHRWTACFVPMQMDLCAKLLGSLRCSNCGAGAHAIHHVAVPTIRLS